MKIYSELKKHGGIFRECANAWQTGVDVFTKPRVYKEPNKKELDKQLRRIREDAR